LSARKNELISIISVIDFLSLKIFFSIMSKMVVATKSTFINFQKIVFLYLRSNRHKKYILLKRHFLKPLHIFLTYFWQIIYLEFVLDGEVNYGLMFASLNKNVKRRNFNFWSVIIKNCYWSE